MKSLKYPQLLLDYGAGQAAGADVVPQIDVPLWVAADGPVEIGGLPAGGYVCREEIPLGPRPVESTRRDVHVERDGVEDLVVDVAEWAGLEVTVDLGKDAPGPFRGSIELTLRRSGAKASYKVNLTRPPFVIAGMQPGTYEVVEGNAMAAIEPFTVELERNKVTRVVRPGTTIPGPMSSRR